MKFEDITYFLKKLAKIAVHLTIFHFSVICVRFMYKYLTLCYIFFLFLSDAVCLFERHFLFPMFMPKPCSGDFKGLYCVGDGVSYQQSFRSVNITRLTDTLLFAFRKTHMQLVLWNYGLYAVYI